ncbi:30S ribosomal protein S9 [Candidatus Roizmanbacteria bacterium CG09_land_8_20_14_0_10_41_9]|uniref:Small ribosomal subunit protein uS9 n=1 Tax=Candidatus Roizmanbacteria bacterium CG09_land_8_20_14_0_10_41_9 TaxID=1974850 RepID=A0A2H0WS76_9BACT|nr:MAG: 30S ribosomal protein S9 [Candidatus Roizmanbacteria bacterium CG09_land_8_20_14_0_10_41_9]
MPKKTKKVTYYEGIGRRKESVARVRLYIVAGKDKTVTVGSQKIKVGSLYVNKNPIEKLFGASHEKSQYLALLKLTGSEDRFAISILARGGGRTGQLEAIIHGLAHALDKVDTDAYHSLIKKEGYFTRDPRVRQRRHVGTGGKARRAKQSPKR